MIFESRVSKEDAFGDSPKHARRNSEKQLFGHMVQAMSEARLRGIEEESTSSRCNQDVALIRCIITPADESRYLLVVRSCRALDSRLGITKHFYVQISGF